MTQVKMVKAFAPSEELPIGSLIQSPLALVNDKVVWKNDMGLPLHYAKKHEKEDQVRLNALLKVRPYKITQRPGDEFCARQMEYIYDSDDRLTHLVIHYFDSLNNTSRMVTVPD